MTTRSAKSNIEKLGFMIVLTVERGFAANLRTGRANGPDARLRLRCLAPNSFSSKRIKGQEFEAEGFARPPPSQEDRGRRR